MMKMAYLPPAGTVLPEIVLLMIVAVLETPPVNMPRALAALLAGKLDIAGKTAVVVLSGGNVDPELFARLVA